jgi:predicted ATPase/class 3 adenylate cyclase
LNRFAKRRKITLKEHAGKLEVRHMSKTAKSGVARKVEPFEASAGVMVFLLTDIEGSTSRWEDYPDAMRRALLRHDRILRDAAQARRGHVFRTAGDSFHVAFSAPEAAVAVALQAQRELTREDFSAVGGLKVRMAIHAGSVARHGDDYHGPGINRSARLLHVAYGGQVLVSGTVADLVAGKLPSGTELFDLGRHRFRDLPESEQVYQLVASGLAGAFPPLRSLGAKFHHLPKPPTPLINRETDVAEAKKRLARYRLLTLIGSGGAGKTRVAIQVGSELLDDYPDGVWFIELAPIEDPQLVAEQISASLGLTAQGARSALETVVNFLHSKHALLILDNCEHLVAAVARVVDMVIARCPSVSILATSRENLAVAGESTYRVPSLALPPLAETMSAAKAMRYPAVQLFVDRATAAGDFELTDANVEAVASICNQIDGIPLAIELAAPRLRIMHPQGLAERLRDRFGLLESGTRSALPRHRTLRTLFDWSYNLLDPREQTLLRRLSVFAGGWTANGAAAVVAGDLVVEGEVFDLISSLVDKSLVVADLSREEPRYKLLDTTRQYAFERLREAGERGCRAQLAVYIADCYGTSAKSWPTVATAEWLARYEPELDNLRASLEWAFGPEGDVLLGTEIVASSLRIWDELSLLMERERWFTIAAAQLTDATPPDVAARLWLGRTSVSSHGDRSAFGMAIKAVEAFQKIGDELGRGEALTKAGASLLTPDSREEATVYLDRAFTILEPYGPTKQLASCLRSMAVAAYFAADYAAARPLVKRSAAVARAVGDTRGLVNAQIALGELEFAAGEVQSAITTVRDMINGGDHNRRQLSLGLGNLTAYLLAAERVTEAKLTAFSGLHKARALGWPAATARMIEHLALITGLQSDAERAARLLGYSEAFYVGGTASREITEQRGFDRLLTLLSSTLEPDELAKLRVEGSRLSENEAIEMAMTI